MGLSPIEKWHLHDFQINWINNKANKVAINEYYTRKLLITDSSGGQDPEIPGWDENFKISKKFSEQKTVKLPRRGCFKKLWPQ